MKGGRCLSNSFWLRPLLLLHSTVTVPTPYLSSSSVNSPKSRCYAVAHTSAPSMLYPSVALRSGSGLVNTGTSKVYHVQIH